MLSAMVHGRNERYVQLEWLEGHRAGMHRAIEGTVEGQISNVVQGEGQHLGLWHTIST